MSLYYADDTVTVHLGDCLDVLKTMPDASVDSVVCDPPYGLTELTTALVLQAIAAWMAGDRDHVPDGRGFMGKDWDRFVPPPGVWDECLRVLKPGGHLLAFAGTRAWDLMTLSIRIAGFEIRDTVADLTGQDAPGLAWTYGQGFPKSLDVGKAIDRQRDDRDAIVSVTTWLAEHAETKGVTRADVDRHMGTSDMGGWWLTRLRHRCQVPTWEQWLKLRELIGFGDEMDTEVWRLNGRKGQPGEAWADRPVVGERTTGIGTGRGTVAYIGDSANRTLTAAATDASKRWEGWGTALKPGWEPIVVARKPLAGTVASNVLTYGTGALNIDGCRISAGQDYRDKCASVVGLDSNRNGAAYGEWTGTREDSASPLGRWPTNLVFTHSADCVDPAPCAPDCPVAELDRQSGASTSRVGKPRGADAGAGWGMTKTGAEYDDQGGASRFFPVFRYEAKAPASERPKLPDGTAHATVKPLGLMRWLVRLVTPPGGLVCDPFAGSGTTGEACVVEGFRAVLIEQDPAHAELIKARLSKPIQPNLFGEVTS